MPEKHNRIVALSGAGSGIGRALAIAFARRGDVLALADLDTAGLADTYALLPSGTRASVHTVDVSDKAQVDAFAAEVLHVHGRIDVAINNAGVGIAGTVAELTADEMAWVMNVNFWGVVHGTKAFLPAMLAQRSGTIVNVSSVFGLWGPPGQAAYAASKFAVRGFSEALRAEVNASGIHVVCVFPAGIKTNIARRSRIAAAADQARGAKWKASFERNLLTIPPQEAARAIMRGIDGSRDRVLIGTDAFRIDAMVRLLGSRGARMLGAAVARGVAHIR